MCCRLVILENTNVQRTAGVTLLLTMTEIWSSTTRWIAVNASNVAKS